MLFDFPERLQYGRRWLPCALLLSITSALYGATLYYNFVWDDWTYVGKNYRVQALDWRHIRAFWTGTFLGHYAPVHHTFFALVYHFSGLDPFGYHLGQLLVHAACVCLVYILLARMESPRVALLASLLFVVHPANVETVAWISESKSTLALLFFLLSFLAFIRFRESDRWLYAVLAAFLMMLSVLAKINTVVAPAIFLLYDYRQGASVKTLRWRGLLPFFVLAGVFTLVHLKAFHGSAQALDSEYYGGFAVHLMNLPLLLSFYLQITVFPYALSAWEMFPVQGHFTALVALGWAGLLALSFLLFRSPRRTQFWALWFFIFLLPVLQIIPFPIWVADRYLYVPGIGAFALIAGWFFRGFDGLRQFYPRLGLELAMLSAVALLAWKTTRQVPIWANDLSLWAATIPTCEMSAYCHMNFGLALLSNNQPQQGIQELIEAAKVRKGGDALQRLGDAFTLSARDYRQGIAAYELALQQDGQSPGTELYGKLARAYYLSGDLKDASRATASGKQMSGEDPGVWIADGFVLWKQGDWESARYSLRRALALAGGTPKSAPFFTEFMGDPAQVGRMLADLRSSAAGPTNKPVVQTK